VIARVTRSAIRAAVVGATNGIAIAIVFTRMLQAVLYGVQTTGAVSYVSAAAVLLLVTAGSAFLPALQATRINAVDVLRSE
jgi:ABC-type antimicrobial peptide transport system permease subunit